ncbi:MAG: hypothetical protein KGL39_13770 [Patescibacteria group bacterium]|nr:hypothetical protein [Patescibacteria group bacterium]
MAKNEGNCDTTSDLLKVVEDGNMAKFVERLMAMSDAAVEDVKPDMVMILAVCGQDRNDEGLTAGVSLVVRACCEKHRDMTLLLAKEMGTRALGDRKFKILRVEDALGGTVH